MSGTFSSLNTALSALRYNRVAMDVASGNVANSGTAGYARRQVIGQATGAPAVVAMWSRWETGMGDGVQPGGITRMVDPLLDARARLEHAASSYLDTRVVSLARFETALGEPGDNGIAAALSDFQQGWHDIANNPADGAARSQLLARAETLRVSDRRPGPGGPHRVGRPALPPRRPRGRGQLGRRRARHPQRRAAQRPRRRHRGRRAARPARPAHAPRSPSSPAARSRSTRTPPST